MLAAYVAARIANVESSGSSAGHLTACKPCRAAARSNSESSISRSSAQRQAPKPRPPGSSAASTGRHSHGPGSVRRIRSATR